MSLAEAIRRIRVQQGLTQTEIGNRCGLATSYVSRIETGRIQPTMTTMDKLAAALGVSLSEIFAVPESDPEPGHRCPVSSSGQCIGSLIRDDDPTASDGSVHYTESELHLLRMADFLIHNGRPEVRQTLKTMLEALLAAHQQGS